MIDNPWHRLPDRAPFVLPEDEGAVRDFNGQASEDHKLRIGDLLPEPFVGDPCAPVVLLGTNPGFTPEGAARKKEDSRFVERMRDNLVHKDSDYRFVFFAPDIQASHKDWWNRKLKGLLDHFDYSVLARSILAVEHFPYPSRRYGAGRLHLRSQAYSFSLVERAMERKAIIVLVRGERKWLKAVPALCKYEGLCKLRNPQAGSISHKNCPRFEEVVRTIEAGVAE
jgi:hypothetical protein